MQDAKRLGRLFYLFIFTCFLIKPLWAEPEVLTVYVRDSFYEKWHERLSQGIPGKVRFIRLSGSSLMGRLRLEGASTKADIVLGGDSCFGPLLKERGCVGASNINPCAYDVPVQWDKDFVPFCYGYLGVLYDERVPFPLPQSWQEILSLPEKTLLLPNPHTSSVGLVFWQMIATLNLDEVAFISRVRATPKGLSQAFGLFATNKAPFVVAYTTSAAHREAVFKNHHIKPLIFDAHPFLAYVAFATPKGSQNPHARAFLKRLLDDDVQDLIFEVDHLYPVKVNARARAGLLEDSPRPLEMLPPLNKEAYAKLIERFQKIRP
jgi:thiamine transport system substrate-binding protein